MSRLLILSRTVVLASVMLLSGLANASFSQIVSFGDSLSDTGNVYAASGATTPPAPYFNGRFSNGPVWNEVLATGLGLPAPTPSVTGGTNFAWGGARTISGGSVPTTQTQVGDYLTAVGGVADPSALFTLWSGGNDINDGIGSIVAAILGGGDGVAETAAAQAALSASAGALATMAQDLLNAGATNILLVNVPDLGIAPVADGAEALASGLSAYFNGALNAAFSGLLGNGVTLLDAFTISQDIAANPAAFGLTDASNKCFDSGVPSICPNPEDFLFWDDLHPTAAGHSLIGHAAVAAVVPVPAALPLLLSAFAGLGLVRRLHA